MATTHRTDTLRVATNGKGLVEITDAVAAFAAASRIDVGTLTVFCKHTSASLLIQENADPSAMHDLLAWFDRIAPEGDPRYTHTLEGPDDMPSHLRAAITRTSEVIPIVDGKLALGTWQGVYVFEHRVQPHTRSIVLVAQGS